MQLLSVQAGAGQLLGPRMLSSGGGGVDAGSYDLLTTPAQHDRPQ